MFIPLSRNISTSKVLQAGAIYLNGREGRVNILKPTTRMAVSKIGQHGLLLLMLLLVAVRGADAHGGHMEKIPEGQAISDDPIVCPDSQVASNSYR